MATIRELTRAQIYEDARVMTELWTRELGKAAVLRFLQDRAVTRGEPAAFMTLAAFLHFNPHLAGTMVDEIQTHLAPDME